MQGESIDLCIPSSLAIEEDKWASWFNKTEQLQFTGHGVFPNTRDKQAIILKDCAKTDRIVLLVCRKDNQKAIGVISLQNIDQRIKQAEIAIMIGEQTELPLASLSSLEAMALISAHGMDQLGLNRIWAGQVYPGLAGWNKLLEVIGYKAEGIHRQAFLRGHQYSDLVHIALNYEDYCKIVDKRGLLWPGIKEIKRVLRKQPARSFSDKLNTQIDSLADEHFTYLFD